VAIKAAKGRNKPYKLTDSDGLHLLVLPNGGRYWRINSRYHGKRGGSEHVQSGRRGMVCECRKARAGPCHTQKIPWLLTFVYASFGNRPIANISPHELLAVLRKFEVRGKYESAKRLRSTCGQVFRYVIATARANRDLSADLRGALISVKVTHRAAVTTANGVSALLRVIDSYEGHAVTVTALKLLLHVFVRLSSLLFPSLRSVKRPMSENTINAALRRLGYAQGEMTGHGYRATASTLLNEMGKWNPDAIERQLAHADTNAVHRAATSVSSAAISGRPLSCCQNCRHYLQLTHRPSTHIRRVRTNIGHRLLADGDQAALRAVEVVDFENHGREQDGQQDRRKADARARQSGHVATERQCHRRQRIEQDEHRIGNVIAVCGKPLLMEIEHLAQRLQELAVRDGVRIKRADLDRLVPKTVLQRERRHGDFLQPLRLIVAH
jgi:integrase